MKSLALESSKQSFEELYREHRSMVRAVIFNISGSQDLDDQVQETFIKLWSGIHRFEGKSSLRTWIYRITVNTALDHARKKKRWRFGKLKERMPADEDTEAKVSHSVLVQRGLAELSEEQRSAVVLNVLEGLTVPEIAAILEVPEGTVRSRIHYGKQALARFLTEKGVPL